MNRDRLLEARGMQVDGVAGAIDVLRAIIVKDVTGWEDLEALYKESKLNLLKEAAKASEDPVLRSTFQLGPDEKLCPHRYARYTGQIREHGFLQNHLTAYLLSIAK
jgi:hypothetical protein